MKTLIIIICSHILLYPCKQLFSNELGKHRQEGSFGFTVSQDIGFRMPFWRMSNEFSDHQIGSAYELQSISLFYNPIESQTFGVRIYQNRDDSNLRSYNYGLVSFGLYQLQASYARPNVELFYRLYVFDTSFYVAGILGNASPKNIEVNRDYTSRFILSRIEDQYAPYSMTYEVASRFYGGLELGYSTTFFDYIFFSIGYNVKIAENSRIKYSNRYRLEDYFLNDGQFNTENFLFNTLIRGDSEGDLIRDRIGSNTIYVEIGLIF